MADELTGSCLCGSLQFTARPPFRPIVACHCRQCRKQTGHYTAAAAALRAHVEISEDSALAWYSSGPNSRRGFCRVCGSTLFFEVIGGERISFMAGAIDGPTGLEMKAHIFTAEKGDYYDLPANCDAHDGDFPPALGIPREE